MPMRGPPRCVYSPEVGKPFEVMPVPASSTLGLVGSSARLAIDSERWLSLRGVQLALPLRVTHTPPLVPPIYIVPALRGSVTIAWTAPETVPLGGASALWMVPLGPLLGEGPCGTNVWARATGVAVAQRAATRRAVKCDLVKGRSVRGRAMAGSTSKIRHRLPSVLASASRKR